MTHTLVSIMHMWLFGMAKCLHSLPIPPRMFRIRNVKVLLTTHPFLRAKLGVLPKTTMIPSDLAKTLASAVK